MIGLCGCVWGLSAQQTNTERARQLWEWVKADCTDSIHSHLNGKMQQLVTPQQLKGMWQQLQQQLGACQSEEEWKQDSMQGMVLYYKDLVFKTTRLRFLVAFDADGRANTLRILPAPAEAKPVPAVLDSTRLEERPVEVVTDSFRLPGVVTLPRGGKGLPVVVLVHGSGPQDRDETIGPNKPFRDLAWMLAGQGIAVVRYDKRTYVYRDRSVAEGQSITPDEEVVNDALSAIRLASVLPFVDKHRVFVAGHSLGGLMAPRVASHTDLLAGVILLAAPARPLLKVAEGQMRYLASLNGGVTDEAAIQQQLRTFKQSVPDSYWDYLSEYQPVLTAHSLKLPLLFLQGERDYQVTMEDFGLWQLGLFGKPGATFESFPTLNHLFMEGTGKSTPMEYNHPAHMSSLVADAIAAWIHSLKSTEG